MKFTVRLILILLCFSCKTSDSFVGTTGSRYETNPFLSMEEWVNTAKEISNKISKKSNSTLLWSIGTYRDDGILLNYDGKDNINSGIYYSELDFNEKYFTFFNKEDISVYLQVEYGSAEMDVVIYDALKRYQKNRCIKGICIDVDWNNQGLAAEDLARFSQVVTDINKNYKLLIKGWDRESIPQVYEPNIIYINKMKNISSKDDAIKRSFLWYKRFYPNTIGFEIGYSQNVNLWSNFSIVDFYTEVTESGVDHDFLLWSGSTLDMIQ